MMDEFRDHIATVNQQGKRVWIFPKKPKGSYTNKRKIVSYLFLALLFAIPHIKMNGEQLLLFNIIERKFVIFGAIFWPQDFYLFAIMLIIGVVFVILFTIIYGRLFCGWICPQTIFMEFVFRQIEYLIEGDWTAQKKLAKQAWNSEKIIKRSIKFIVFWVVSFLVANTFLAYIIGTEELWKIQTDPLNTHLGGLIAIIIFSSLFFFVYWYLREQVCTTICPYGRLQGVLLDANSMVVAYDHVRGEGRAKFKKGEDRKTEGKGDCIDCGQCVHVCPTGIDIRNGTQLECINCTACIDSCDTIMEGVGQDKGLIRFVSENGIKNRTGFEWTKRVKAYTVLLIGLIGVLLTLLIIRDDFSTIILRQRGSTFQITDEDQISNIFEIDLTNKTKNTYDVKLKCSDPNVSVELANDQFTLKGQKHLTDRFVIKTPYNNIKNGMKKVDIIVVGNGKEIDRVGIKILGPNY
jgi:cytochrome c oxidase accessory protein FixG